MSPTPDSYEAKYMGAEEAIVRGRKLMPWWFFLIFVAATAASVGSAIASGSAAALISVPILVVVALLFSVLRLVVTREHLHAQMGLWGPKVAIRDITKIEAMDYPFMRYGGWGIRMGVDGSWAYSIPGGTGIGVRVEWRVGDKTKAAFVSCEDADEVVRAVRELQAKSADGTGVRVEESAEAKAPEESEARREEGGEKKREG